MEEQIKPEKLVFVTGNRCKFVEAEKVGKRYGVDLRNETLEIVEIQSDDPAAVAQAKVREAFRMLKCPVVVHDASWSIPALRGFPGAYMHDMVRWFRPEDWLNLMREHLDRTVEVCENVTYYDGQEMKSFQYRQKGYFVDAPRGENGNSLEKVVVLADDKTIAEYHDIGIENNSVVLKAWEEFFEWYRARLWKVE